MKVAKATSTINSCNCQPHNISRPTRELLLFMKHLLCADDLNEESMVDSTPKFTLYVNNHCPSCKVVAEYIKRNALACDVVNIDLSEQEPPLDLMVFPALFQNSRLLAYGEDIITRLSRQA